MKTDENTKTLESKFKIAQTNKEKEKRAIEPPNYRIDGKEAARLISAFLNHEVLNTIGIDIAIGGLLKKELSNKEVYEGILFRFCYNTNYIIPTLPKFFLAYETSVYPIPHENPIPINQDELERANNKYIFRYPIERGISQDEVLTFLETPMKKWENDEKEPDLLIGKSDVQLLNSNFLNHFPGLNNDNPFNTYPYGFFELNEMHLLQSQSGTKYIRYYFGYDINSPINKIRIILTCVDPDGKNLLDNSYFAFEQSWPPNIGVSRNTTVKLK